MVFIDIRPSLHFLARVQTTNYNEFVHSLCKRGDQIKDDMTPQQAELLHMATGASGEAGELLDAIKKHSIYQKPLNIHNVVEEMGDIEFFLTGLRNLLNISREEVILQNMEKLSKRYHEGKYSNEQAINRADKEIEK